MEKTIAEHWLEKIDHPKPPTPCGISRDAVDRMMGDAADVIQDGSPRYTDLYVFRDGSGIYEKRQDDWFVMEAEDMPGYSEPEEDEGLLENNDR